MCSLFSAPTSDTQTNRVVMKGCESEAPYLEDAVMKEEVHEESLWLGFSCYPPVCFRYISLPLLGPFFLIVKIMVPLEASFILISFIGIFLYNHFYMISFGP